MNRTRIVPTALGCVLGLVSLPTGGTAAPVPAEGKSPYVKWSVVEPVGGTGMNEPLVIGDVVVVGTDNGELRAYRIGTGAPAWTYAGGKRIFHRPAADGEQVYFTNSDGLTAVAADTGKKVWGFSLDRSAGPVLALPAKGLVFAADGSGTLYAVDARTGGTRWSADFAADAPPDPPGFDGNQARLQNTKARPTALTCDGETVYLSVFDQSRIVAVAAATGKRLWSFQARGWIYGAAVTTPTRVLIGSQDESFYCLDRRTGKQVWKFETKGRIESGGATDDTSVYFGACDGNLYRVALSDGKERWRFTADPNPNGRKTAIYSVPILRNGAVHFAAGEGQFYAVAADTGKVRWKLRAGELSDLYCSPATDGRSYFVTTRPRSGSGRGMSEGVSSLVAISLK